MWESIICFAYNGIFSGRYQLIRRGWHKSAQAISNIAAAPRPASLTSNSLLSTPNIVNQCIISSQARYTRFVARTILNNIFWRTCVIPIIFVNCLGDRVTLLLPTSDPPRLHTNTICHNNTFETSSWSWWKPH